MKLHTASAACHTRAHCAACQDAGAEGVAFRLSRRAAGYEDMPADGSVIFCVHGQKPPPIVTADSGGPGTELKRMLARRLFRWLGVREFPGCKCNALAREMNERGCAWCDEDENETYIVGELAKNHEALLADKEEHGDRSFTAPFSEGAARLMVRAAVRLARRKGVRVGR